MSENQEIYVVSVIPRYILDGRESVDNFVSCFQDRRTAVEFMVESVREIYVEIKEAIDVGDDMEYPSFDKDDVESLLEEYGEYVFECKEHMNWKFIYAASFRIYAVDLI